MLLLSPPVQLLPTPPPECHKLLLLLLILTLPATAITNTSYSYYTAVVAAAVDSKRLFYCGCCRPSLDTEQTLIVLHYRQFRFHFAFQQKITWWIRFSTVLIINARVEMSIALMSRDSMYSVQRPTGDMIKSHHHRSTSSSPTSSLFMWATEYVVSDRKSLWFTATWPGCRTVWEVTDRLHK